MKHVLALLAALVSATPALAQTPPAPSAAPAPTAAPSAAAAPTADGAGEDAGAPGDIKALRTSCRQDAENGGLQGPARREAVSACVVRHRPDLAAREQCRNDGFAKGLRKDELHAFVKTCLHPKG